MPKKNQSKIRRSRDICARTHVPAPNSETSCHRPRDHSLVISTYQVISPRISLSELLLLLLPTLSSIHPWLACYGGRGAPRGGGRRDEILRGTGRPHRCSIADSECRGRGRRGVVAEVVVVKRSGSRHYTMMSDGYRFALLLFLLFLDDGRCAETATWKHTSLNISNISATELNVLPSCDICVAVPTLVRY